MTYRGVYRDGVIVLSGDVDLQNGDTVDVNRNSAAGVTPKRKPVSADKKRARAGSSKKKQSEHPFLALAGMWKDRKDWRGKSSVKVVAEIRDRGRSAKRPKRVRRG